MLGSIVTYLAASASITGKSLKDVLRARGNKKELFTLFQDAKAFLVRFEEPDDPLVGYWRLRNWDFRSFNLPEYLVSGGLAIYPRDRNVDSWKGVMCLEYGEGPYPKFIKRKGYPPPFIATYNVAFRSPDKKAYSGDCHMREKEEYGVRSRILESLRWPNPRIRYKWRGEFLDCSIIGQGSSTIFSGRYQNYPKRGTGTGTADFAFHLRMKWGEIEVERFDL